MQCILLKNGNAEVSPVSPFPPGLTHTSQWEMPKKWNNFQRLLTVYISSILTTAYAFVFTCSRLPFVSTLGLCELFVLFYR